MKAEKFSKTQLKTMEIHEAYAKVLEVTGQTEIAALADLINKFDEQEYVAAKIHNNKEWAHHTRSFGRNYIMSHADGVFAELRNKKIRIGTINKLKDAQVYANGFAFCIIKRSDLSSVDTYETVKKFIEGDIPVFIEGYSGWGKSSIVNQVAEDLGLPIITLSLASISPEDFGGIPRVQNDSYFKYVLPEWALRYKEPFVLFLDEINQAPISVLHACYGLVLDRVLNGTKLPCKIVAAGNFLSENEYLTDISEIKPLMERFHKYTINHDKVKALSYLEQKYGYMLSGLLSIDWEMTSLNPRRIEKYIKMIQAGITSQELATNPEKPAEAAYHILEKIINGVTLDADDVATKVEKALADNEVQIEEGLETSLYNELMSQAV